MIARHALSHHVRNCNLFDPDVSSFLHRQSVSKRDYAPVRMWHTTSVTDALRHSAPRAPPACKYPVQLDNGGGSDNRREG